MNLAPEYLRDPMYVTIMMSGEENLNSRVLRFGAFYGLLIHCKQDKRHGKKLNMELGRLI
jgi:hypothetical protein